MRLSLVLAPAALAVTLAGCSPKFDPASYVEKLRVVAVRAEPPEIDPGGVATLETLVLRPDFATTVRTTTIVHVACVPDPRRPDQFSPCVMLPNLVAPAATVAAAARMACAAPLVDGPLWPPIDLAGVERCDGGGCDPASIGTTALPPRVTVPAAFGFTPDGPDNVLGVQAQVLSFAVEATPDELVEPVGTICAGGDDRARLAAQVAVNLARLWEAREHVLSEKRVWIRGPAAVNPPNRNPAVTGITAGSLTLDPGAATTVHTGELDLRPVLPSDPAEQPEGYWKLDATGALIEHVTEQWAFSWFATAGELKKVNTHDAGDPDRWKLSEARGPARVAVVVRDLRGGTSWAVRDVEVAP
jgi:hypothetical protein